MSEPISNNSGFENTHEPLQLSSVDWNFPNEDTQYLTHGIHQYPARMVPQIADHMFSYFLNRGDIQPGDWIFDPFAGSGTTGVEARIHGLNSILVDLNPLACLISEVKSTPLDPVLIEIVLNALKTGGHSYIPITDGLNQVDQNSDGFDIDLGSDYNWFPEPQLSQLVYLRNRIDELEALINSKVLRFFRVTLSETSRRVSYQRNDEFKRYRMSEEDRESFDPDVWEIFSEILSSNLDKMREYHSRVDGDLQTIIQEANSRNLPMIDENSVDMILTSPPYGDHKTTVAYGQFSKDPAVISIGANPDSMWGVDKNGLGGYNYQSNLMPRLRKISKTLDLTINELEDNEGRNKDAVQFFSDYFEAIKETKRILKPGQPIVLVVANRTMSRVNIPTHKITKELYSYLGFSLEEMIPRSIPTKTLPFENNPEGIPGQPGDLMAKEYLLVFRSPTT